MKQLQSSDLTLRASSSFQVIALFFLSLGLFIGGTLSQEVIGFDSRFYVFALEMYQKGLSWFPTTYFQPYPDYPATSTVAIYLLALLFGGLNKMIAVLPTAICAAITVVFTFLIGKRYNERWGWYAVLLLPMTLTFLQLARSISLDMAVTLFTTLSFYVVDGKQKKYQWLILLFLFLGFAWRGPIGLVIPAGVVCIYYMINQQWRQLIYFAIAAFILLIASCSVLLALAYQTADISFVQDVWRMQALGRINNDFSPWYFYFVQSLMNYAVTFPLAILTIIGLSFSYNKQQLVTPQRRVLWQLCGWLLVVLIGMSIPGDKKTRYILPIAPAIALLAAYFFVAPQRERFFAYSKRFIISLFALFPLINIGALLFFSFYSILLLMFLSLLQLINVLTRKTLIIVINAMLCFVLSYLILVEPTLLALDKTQAFVQQIEFARLKHHAQLVFYRERSDGMPIKYRLNMPQLTQPIFIDNEAALLAIRQPTFFITSESFFNTLSSTALKALTIIAKGKIGHEPVIVFIKGKH